MIEPEKGQAQALQQLHEGHPGNSRMKGIARSITSWSGIDKQIAQQVSGQSIHNHASTSPTVDPSLENTSLWCYRRTFQMARDNASVLHIHFKYNLETSFRFATHGLPEVIVSDNASCFTSWEFQEFTTQNGIHHITPPPYHPATKGLAEMVVQTIKNALKKSSTDYLETRLSRFLFHYRTTPHSTTGASRVTSGSTPEISAHSNNHSRSTYMTFMLRKDTSR